jgi:hypothetical protein
MLRDIKEDGRSAVRLGIGLSGLNLDRIRATVSTA